ncbi:hypothetical protein RU639_001840 [Aspergillus parasiticus]
MVVFSIILSLLLLMAGWLTAICFTPPQPDRFQRHIQNDRIGFLSTISIWVFHRYAIMTVAFWHVFLAIHMSLISKDSQLTTPLCPGASHVNPCLFTWSRLTFPSLALILLVGGPIRLAAFKHLGENFTFHITTPDRLVTQGIYHYMQHPSYVGQLILVAACSRLFWSWDGSLGCFVTASLAENMRGAEWLFSFGLTAIFLLAFGVRIRDEEHMLKERFGEKWIAWNRRTKRFIPGII